ncbi:MAG TPA: APC family permease [Gemmatimonadaceae bacterium]|nr:APC family permease [Gemmatimonadaceae bacterium]
MTTAYSQLKRLVFGQPLASDRLEHERLNKKTALAVLSSDAISSVAYATDQILFVVGGALGLASLSYVLPISAVIVGLLVLVGISYSQTIRAYPGGGGSYTVAKENLGTSSGLVAAAALLTDYVLTVAVSISSGVAAMTSAYPSLIPHTVVLGVASIVLLTIVNLRGVRESGVVFSVPTYAFIAMMLALIGFGIYHVLLGDLSGVVITSPKLDPHTAAAHPTGVATGFAFFYLLLRGFAEGCAAMTGTEAISNGVQAFKEPARSNARRTLGWMVTILAAFFLGVSYLAQHYGAMPTADQTVLSILGHRIFGSGIAYYALQYSTFAVLVLAANTAFADFPRLSSILAHDRYMPRQFQARGDRLAFSNGIVTLGAVALLLVVMFRGDTARLVPLYALGVFVCFTLSQAGMVMHWMRSHDPGWRWRAGLNGLGAAATALVAIVQVVTKFTAGGWIVVVIIPVIIYVLKRIHSHYEHFAEEVRYTGQSPLMFLHHTVVVPVNGITKPAAGALVYATTISEDVRAAYIEVDAAATADLRRQWDAWDIGVDLVVLPSPYRSILRPLVEYVDGLAARGEADLVTVVVPEIVPRSWLGHLLHNKTSLFIRTAFLFRPNVVVTAVPYRIGRAARLRQRAVHDDSLDLDLVSS